MKAIWNGGKMISLEVDDGNFFESLRNHFEEFGFVMVDSKKYFIAFKYGKRTFHIKSKHKYATNIPYIQAKVYDRNKRVLEIYPERVLEQYKKLDENESKRKTAKNVIGVSSIFFQAQVAEMFESIPGLKFDSVNYWVKIIYIVFKYNEKYDVQLNFRSNKTYDYLSNADLFKEPWDWFFVDRGDMYLKEYYRFEKKKPLTEIFEDVKEFLENYKPKIEKELENFYGETFVA